MRDGPGDNSDTHTEDPSGRSGGLYRRVNVLYALLPCSTNMYTPPYLSSRLRDAQQKPIRRRAALLVLAVSSRDSCCARRALFGRCVSRYIAAFLTVTVRRGVRPSLEAGEGGCVAENVYLDHAGGAKASRPQLVVILQRLRFGRRLVITRREGRDRGSGQRLMSIPTGCSITPVHPLLQSTKHSRRPVSSGGEPA